MKSKSNLEETRFQKELAGSCRGLTYVSEIDSAVLPFFGGDARSVSKLDILDRPDKPKRSPIKEIPFDNFFDRLTSEQEWHTKDDAKRADGFRRLRALLKSELEELHVFKVGSIQIDIYVVGLWKDSKLAGVSMKAIET